MNRNIKNLTGRQVYFKMNKKVYEANKVYMSCLIPSKLYTVTSMLMDKHPRIISEVGNEITCTLKPGVSVHLNDTTGFTLKRLPKVKI